MTVQTTINRIRTGAEIGFVVIVCLFFYRSCHRKPVPPTKDLPPQVQERISVDTRRKEVFIQTPKGVTKKVGVRHAQIDIGKDGSVVVRNPQFGFTFEPGLSLSFDGAFARTGVDAQLGYLGNWGLHVGVSVPITGKAIRLDETHVYPAVSYRLPFRWTPNSAVYAGSSVFNFLHKWEFGIRVAL